MEINKIVKHAYILAQNPGLRNEIQSKLKSFGLYITKSANSAKLSLQDIHDENLPCDLIVMDAKLSDMDASDFLATVRAMPSLSKSHIFIMYSDDEEELLTSYLNSSITGLVKKPFNIDAMGKHLQSRLGKAAIYGNNLEAIGLDTQAAHLEKNQEYQKAMELYHEIEALTKSPQSIFDIARINHFLGNISESKEKFAQLIKDHPGYKTAIANFMKTAPAPVVAQKNINKIPPSAIKLFNIPVSKFQNGFYGSQRLTRTLVVGGEHSQRIMIKNILGDLEIKGVSLENSGENALNIIAKEKIDLVIVNLNINDMNGLQFVELMQRNELAKNTLIMMLVDEGFEKNVLDGFAIGMDGFLTTPVTSGRLSMSLHQMYLQEDLTTLCNEAKSLTKSGFFSMQMHEFEKAEEFCGQAIDTNPTDAMAHLYLAMINQWLDSPEASDAYYEKASQLNRDLAEITAQTKLTVEGEIKLKKSKEKAVVTEDYGSDSNEFDSWEDDYDESGNNSDSQDDFVGYSDDEKATTTDSGKVDFTDFTPFEESKENEENDAPKKKLDFSKKNIETRDDSSWRAEENDNENLQIPDFAFHKKKNKETHYTQNNPIAEIKPRNNSKNTSGETNTLHVDIPLEYNEAQEEQESSSDFYAKDMADSVSFETDQSLKQREKKENLRNSKGQRTHHISEILQPESIRIPKLTGNSGFSETLKPKVDKRDSSLHLNDLITQESISFVNNNVSYEDLASLKENLHYGVSPAHYAMSGKIEQVLSKSGKVTKTHDEHVVKMIGTEVSEWMPSAKLENVSRFLNSNGVENFFDKIENISDEQYTEQRHNLVKSTKTFINQARLFNSRVVSTPDEEEKSISNKNYLDSIGRSIAENNLTDMLEENIKLDKEIKKLIIKAKKKNDGELYEKIGEKLIKEGVLDEIFDTVENKLAYHMSHSDSLPEQEDPYKIKHLVNFVADLKKPAIKLHEEFLRGKEKFEEQLPYFIQEIEQSNGDMAPLRRALKTDNYSFESFKKLYTALKSHGKEDMKHKLTQEMIRKYKNNELMTDSLTKFLLAMGDKKSAKSLLAKAVKNRADENRLYNLKSLALMAYKDSEYKESISWCKKIISDYKGELEAYNLYGASLNKLDKHKKAISVFLNGLRFHPYSFKLHHNLAIAYSKTGKEEEALKTSKIAKELKEEAADSPKK